MRSYVYHHSVRVCIQGDRVDGGGPTLTALASIDKGRLVCRVRVPRRKDTKNQTGAKRRRVELMMVSRRVNAVFHFFLFDMILSFARSFARYDSMRNYQNEIYRAILYFFFPSEIRRRISQRFRFLLLVSAAIV